jgi:SAM-dependent methyltransferase
MSNQLYGEAAESKPLGLDIPLLPSGVPRVQAYLDLLSSPLFKLVERYSNRFLSDLSQDQDRVLQQWPWPLDPLHTWSRQWEYPYCISCLTHWMQTQRRSESPRLVDLGCGLSFLPGYLHQAGWQVTCCDSDSRLVSVFHQAGLDPTCRLDIADLTTTGYKDSEFDAVICVSVLEHLPDSICEKALAEISRILRSGGLFVLTFDIAINGPEGSINLHAARSLLNSLSTMFNTDLSDIERDIDLVHVAPSDFVTTDWIRSTSPNLLPWKISPGSVVQSLLRLQKPQKPFRSLSVCCLAVQKP